MIFNSIKFQRVPHVFTLIFGLFLLINCHELLAAQFALVKEERAIVYADIHMTSPVGYLSKGKKILVSDKSKNKGQVYALIVSGRVAYISSADVSTEIESVGTSDLSAERYKLQTFKKRHTSYSLLGHIFPSKINFDKSNGGIAPGDMLTWTGISMKGSTETKSEYDLDFIFNYMIASGSKEKFRAVELGLGLSWKILKSNKTDFKFYTHGLIIPFTSYEVEDQFRKNAFGFGAGAGINASQLLTKNLGIEIFAGVYANKFSTFNSPAPYNQLAPWLIGPRLGAGLNYHY